MQYYIMGKGSSKLCASPLVRLCKERNESIKAAKNCRYDFVASFMVYLESLLELGNALNNYVENELVICGDCSHSIQLSPSDFDPSEKEEDSSLESTSSDLDSDLCSNCDHSQCEKEEEEESLGLHDTPQVFEESCIHKHNSEACVDKNNNMRNKGSFNFCSNSIHHHGNQENGYIHGHHEYDHQRVPFDNKWETPKSGNWFPQNMNQGSFGSPISFSYYNDRFIHNGAQAFPMHVASSYEEPQKNGTEKNNTDNSTLPIPPPPPPPPPQVSTWDFLYPFNTNYDVPFDYDLDVNETRVREGIPDLEDENETEQSSTTAPVVSDEKEIESGAGNHSSCDGTSNVTQSNSNEEEDSLSTKGTKFGICRKDLKRGEDLKSEAEETKEQCSECLGSSSVTTPVASSRTMDLKEAVLDIKNEFKCLFDYGKELSSFMEVDKRPYQPISIKLGAFVSCFMRLTFASEHSLRYSRAWILHKAEMGNNQESLSSILEELYVWEKKLYGEVMVEEKLRIPYDKQLKRLKELDDRGCEFDKIDDALASFKLLNSDINVAVASISAVSREINGLRDNKLLPELNKLIEGLIGLWKVMSSCHQKQFQAISKAKNHVHILDPGKRKKKSSSKATLRLESVILNWGMCFSNFINMQKTFVKHLNDWLMRQIQLEETEKAEDGVGPMSLSDIGAPPIFSVCNDWYNAINMVSESGVSIAISNFASSLHQLYEKQKEEELVKVKVKHHFKDYKHKLKYFCKKNVIISHQCTTFFKKKTSEDFAEAEVPLLSGCDEGLATSRERLLEERKTHQQVIRQVNDLASSFLQEGLSPIFEALGSFCLENMKIYEQLSLPNDSS